MSRSSFCCFPRRWSTSDTRPVFLGVVEAPYYPGAIYIISQFYTRTEVATRIAILYTGNILATAFAGLIAAGIFQLDGVNGMAGWRWLFIIQGGSLLVHLHSIGLHGLEFKSGPELTN